MGKDHAHYGTPWLESSDPLQLTAEGGETSFRRRAPKWYNRGGALLAWPGLHIHH